MKQIINQCAKQNSSTGVWLLYFFSAKLIEYLFLSCIKNWDFFRTTQYVRMIDLAVNETNWDDLATSLHYLSAKLVNILTNPQFISPTIHFFLFFFFFSCDIPYSLLLFYVLGFLHQSINTTPYNSINLKLVRALQNLFIRQNASGVHCKADSSDSWRLKKKQTVKPFFFSTLHMRRRIFLCGGICYLHRLWSKSKIP